MYENAKSCVKLSSSISEYFPCNVGVRQGENLSPLLFAVYLNDFEFYISRNYKGLDLCASEIRNNLSDDDIEVFLRMFVLLYADDTIVMAESAGDLQIALNAVYEYCNLWYLTVNTSKTKIVIFSRGKVRSYPHFMFGNSEIEVVDDYVYLGTTLNYNGSYNKAIKKQLTQAQRGMYSLLTKAKRLALPIDIQCELFNQLVTPILLYGSEVWGFHKLDQVEVFHRKFLKGLLHIKKSSANCMAYGELGQFGLTSKVERRMVDFWLRICHGKQHKLSHTMYSLLRKLHDKNEFQSKWIVKVKNILDKCGYSNVWDNPGSFNQNWVKKSVELRLSDMDKQNLISEINQNRLCTNYKLFKKEMGACKYLLELDFLDRVSLARFRCGNHKLPIASNRYSDSQSPMPCTMCDYGVEGDEYHYIFICPAFRSLRELYLKRYYFTRPDHFKFEQLFNVESKKQLCNLAKFVRIIMAQF